MSDTVTIIAPVFIAEKVTVNEQLNHLRENISSLLGVTFKTSLTHGKPDIYPVLLETFQFLSGVFKLKEKSKIDSVLYNLLTCCDSISSSNRTEFFNALCQGFLANSSKEDVLVRLEYLEMFFLSLNESDRGKPQLLRSYLDLSLRHKEFSRLSWLTLPALKRWSAQWGLKLDREKFELLLAVKEVMKASGREKEVLEVLVEISASFPPTKIKEPATELICTVLNKPDEFYLDKYSRLPPLQEEKIINHPQLHQLFQIILMYHYSDYKKFIDAHPKLLAEFKLDPGILENKIKLLTLVDLGAKSTIVTFEQVARTLDLNPNQVDALVIQAVNYGLCQARINSLEETVVFLHVPSRIFNLDQWRYLHARLEQWKNSLLSIQGDIKLT